MIINKHFKNRFTPSLCHKYLTLTVVLTLFLIISYRCNVSAGSELSQVEVVYDLLRENIYAPVKKLEHDIKHLKSICKYKSVNVDFKELQSSDEFKWIFESSGVSLTTPAVSDDGSIIITSTKVGLDLSLKNLINKDPDALPIVVTTILSSLQADPLKKTGKEEWSFDRIPGAAIFQPVFTSDGSIILETIEGADNIPDDLQGHLFAISPDGKNKWADVVTFENEIFIGPPMESNDGTIIVTSIKILSLLDNNTLKEFDTTISGIDPDDGSIKWTFHPSNLETGEPLIITTPPVISRTGDTVFLGVMNIANLKNPAKLEFFIKEFENNVKIDEEKNKALIAAIVNGKEIEPLIEEIENDLELQLNDALKEFIDESFLKFCSVIELDLNDRVVKWQTPLDGFCLTSSILDPENQQVLYSSRTNFTVQIDLQVTVEVEIGDPKDPEGNLEVSFEVEKLTEDNVTIKQIGTVSAVDVLAGDVMWETNIEKPIYLNPVFGLNNEKIIVAGTKGFNVNSDLDKISVTRSGSSVYAINKSDGNVDWESATFDGVIGFSITNSLISFPLLSGSDGSVFFTVFNLEFDVGAVNAISVLKIYALNQEGISKWETPYTPDGLLTTEPVINTNGNSIFLSVEDTPKLSDLVPKTRSKLVEIDSNTGTGIKSFKMNGFVFPPPAIDTKENTLFVSASDVEVMFRTFSFDILSFVYALDLD